MTRTPHKGPLDFSEAAHAVMEQVIAKADPASAAEAAADAAKDTPEELPKVAADRKGGKARAEALPPARRSEIAQHAANARSAAEGR